MRLLVAIMRLLVATIMRLLCRWKFMRPRHYASPCRHLVKTAKCGTVENVRQAQRHGGILGSAPDCFCSPKFCCG